MQFKDKQLDLVVTRKPKYFDKAELIQDSCFAVGYDTLIRIIDVKYYDHDFDHLYDSLKKLKYQYGTSFRVAGRLNEQIGFFEEIDQNTFLQLIYE